MEACDQSRRYIYFLAASLVSHTGECGQYDLTDSEVVTSTVKTRGNWMSRLPMLSPASVHSNFARFSRGVGQVW